MLENRSDNRCAAVFGLRRFPRSVVSVGCSRRAACGGNRRFHRRGFQASAGGPSSCGILERSAVIRSRPHPRRDPGGGRKEAKRGGASSPADRTEARSRRHLRGTAHEEEVRADATKPSPSLFRQCSEPVRDGTKGDRPHAGRGYRARFARRQRKRACATAESSGTHPTRPRRRDNRGRRARREPRNSGVLRPTKEAP